MENLGQNGPKTGIKDATIPKAPEEEEKQGFPQPPKLLKKKSIKSKKLASKTGTATSSHTKKGQKQ